MNHQIPVRKKSKTRETHGFCQRAEKTVVLKGDADWCPWNSPQGAWKKEWMN